MEKIKQFKFDDLASPVNSFLQIIYEMLIAMKKIISYSILISV